MAQDIQTPPADAAKENKTKRKVTYTPVRTVSGSELREMAGDGSGVLENEWNDPGVRTFTEDGFKGVYSVQPPEKYHTDEDLEEAMPTGNAAGIGANMVFSGGAIPPSVARDLYKNETSRAGNTSERYARMKEERAWRDNEAKYAVESAIADGFKPDGTSMRNIQEKYVASYYYTSKGRDRYNRIKEETNRLKEYLTPYIEQETAGNPLYQKAVADYRAGKISMEQLAETQEMLRRESPSYKKAAEWSMQQNRQYAQEASDYFAPYMEKEMVPFMEQGLDKSISDFRSLQGERPDEFTGVADNLLNKAEKLRDAARNGGFLTGMGDTASDWNFWSLGIADLYRAKNIREIADKADKALREGADVEFTPEELNTLQAYAIYQQALNLYSEKVPLSYTMGQVTAEMIPFATSIALGQGLASLTTKGISAVAKKAATREVAQAVSQALGKSKLLNSRFAQGFRQGAGFGGGTTGAAGVAGNMLGGMTRGTGEALTVGAPRTWAEKNERMTGQADLDITDSGQPLITGFSGRESGGEAFARALAGNAIEYQSERAGQLMERLGGALKARLPKDLQLSMGYPGDYIKRITPKSLKRFYKSPYYKAFRDNIQLQGVWSEYGEEELANWERVLLGLDEPDVLLDNEQRVETFLSLLPAQLMMGAGAGIYSAGRYRQASARLDKLMKEMKASDPELYEKYGKVRGEMDGFDMEAVTGLLSSIDRDGKLNAGQKTEVKRAALTEYYTKMLKSAQEAEIFGRADEEMRQAYEQAEALKERGSGNIVTADYEGRKVNITDDTGSDTVVIEYVEEDGKRVKRQVPRSAVGNAATVPVADVVNSKADEITARVKAEMQDLEHPGVAAPEPGTRLVHNGENYAVTSISPDGVVIMREDEEGNYSLPEVISTDTYYAEKQAEIDAQEQEQQPQSGEGGEAAQEIASPAEEEPAPVTGGGAVQEETALGRMPKDEQGQPLYEQADAETAWDALLEQAGGDEAMAQEVANDIVSEQEKALKAAERELKKVQDGKPQQRKGDAPLTVEARIAAKQAVREQTSRAQAGVDEARKRLEAWRKIAETPQRRRRAIEAERRQTEKESQEAMQKLKDEVVDNQGNPIGENGRLIVEKVNSIEELTDEDFTNPTRSVELPQLPEAVSDAIGANGKPVVIKKNIFEKNKKTHRDLSAQDSRGIIKAALYSPQLYGQNKKTSRPFNWILIHLADKHSSIVIEVNNNKDNYEIVGWHYLDEEALQQKRNQAVREGGLILTIPQIGSAAGNAPENSKASGSKGSEKSEAVQENSQLSQIEQDASDFPFTYMGQQYVVRPIKTDDKGRYTDWFNGKTVRVDNAPEEATMAVFSPNGMVFEGYAARDNASGEYKLWYKDGKLLDKVPGTEAVREQTSRAQAGVDDGSKPADTHSDNQRSGNKDTQTSAETSQERQKTDSNLSEAFKQQMNIRIGQLSKFIKTKDGKLKKKYESLRKTPFFAIFDSGNIYEGPVAIAKTPREALNVAFNYDIGDFEVLYVDFRTKSLDMDLLSIYDVSGFRGDVYDENGAYKDEAKNLLVERISRLGKGNSTDVQGVEDFQQRESGADALQGNADENIRRAESEVERNPSEAQKEAGNYRKGHVRVDGLDVTIENPKGSVRSGTDADGKRWENVMNNTYGYMRGTEGVDGDHIDVFLSDNPESGNVYVVDQRDPKTGEFDEHKVMYGFGSMEEARDAYLKNYTPGWQGLGTITEVSKDEFRKWIGSSKRKTKPFAEYKSVKKEAGQNESNVPEVGFEITPAQYTTKRGKVLDMFLVKFAESLTKEQQRAAKELARAERGWYDRNKDGFMMRSEESAQKLANTVMGDEETVNDAQPLSLSDMQQSSEPAMRQVDVEGLMQAINRDGEAKLSDHFVIGRPGLTEKATSRQSNSTTQETEQQPAQEENQYGASNKLVSRERYEELKKRMRKKLGGQLNMGIDPEILAIGTEMAAYHIEAGARKFADYARHMIDDLGDAIRPYLKSFYNGARDLPEVQEAGYAEEMTPYDEVRTFDTANFDKSQGDAMATAEMVMAEQEAQAAATAAKEQLTNQRNEQRRQEDEQRTADTKTVADEAEAVASQAESNIEAATDEKEVNEAIRKVDEQLDKVNRQLALLGYYEAEPVENDFNEAYGYMRNAEKKAVKDANSLAKRLIKDLGIDPDTIVDKKGKKRRSYAVANIAPAGGDISIRLPLTNDRELYIDIDLDTDYKEGIRDNLILDHVYFRIENPTVSGQAQYVSNNGWINRDTPYSELLREVRNLVRYHVPEFNLVETSTKSEENKTEKPKKAKKNAVSSHIQGNLFGEIFEEENEPANEPQKFSKGEKVLYKGQPATVFDIEADGRPVLDTGLAPVMYEVAELSDVKRINDNEHGRSKQDTRTNHRGTEPRPETLPASKPVGAGTPVQDAARDSQGQRLRTRNGSGQSGTRPQYDVKRNYTNEEIGEIVASVTDVVDGKVVLTGEATNDIKSIVRQYKSGGVAKQGRGILDEYYTDGKIVDAVNLLISPYFKDGKSARVLEPSVGIGNFIEALRGIKASEIEAFEINETTARITKVLYPQVDVNVRSFETEFIDEEGNKKPLPKKYGLVIGNPPYGSHRGLYKGLGEESKITRYEDYFVKRSLDVLEEGGVLAMVLPSSWIDRHTDYGGYKVEAAYRLPSGAFEATQVGTDIVVLRKDSSVPRAEHAPYFEQHPERVLGVVKQRKGRYGRLEDYVEGDIDAAIEAIEREQAAGLTQRLGMDETGDNVDAVQSAIEETGSADKAAPIVKAAQTTTETSKATKPAPAKAITGKYKLTLNRGAEVVPASRQFTHPFSEEEVEAFADTDYDGTLHSPEEHRPYANYIGGKYVHDFYYAEGDIYEKLAQLERDKQRIIDLFGQTQYDKQKRLLESVLPKRKGLDEITISPNTAFVKNLQITTGEEAKSLKDLFIDFCRKLPYQAFGDSSPREVIGYVNNEQVYGQDKRRNQLVRERRKRAANDLFGKFLREELPAEAQAQVVAAFNREYNSTYRPDYSKVPIFSSINKDFKGKDLKLTSVQLAGIGRMTVKGVGVLAHEVGFGKTLSGVLAMHEAMTRGFARKPLIVVPNDNILQQWVETINEALPNATVNTLGNLGASYDLSDFKVNDGEFTIITYEGLKAMSFHDDTYDRLGARFSYITEDLKSHKSERDKQQAIEKRKELKGKMKRGTKKSYNFEDFGFDWLTFDEVHNANHIVSKVRLDKSVASDFRSQSQRTSDLGMKTWLAAQYIQEQNNGRNVLLLSATPFTNKPLEYYSILSLVGNDMLKRKGFFNVDQFFETFMEADNELEIAANGRPVQKTNIRRFKNNGLFQQLLSEFIDIKGEEDNPDLVRPERRNKEYKIAQNELTAEAMEAVQDLLGDNETVLQGIGHARAAAFSPYATPLLGLRPKGYKEFVENSPKIDAAIQLIEQNKKDRPDAGQIIYSEVGVEFFPMIRDYLVKESGFKPEEVCIITGATSNAERVNIQTAFNEGKVKVVIGSPAIKEGLNLQENTTDMYILSLPWNFTQLRQIEGRGWRQGNKWENIRINYLLTNDSIDVFMLQRLQLKQGLYNEAMKSGAESLDVSDIDTSELKTALITDPNVRAEIETVQERGRLQQEKTRIEADLSFMTRKYEAYKKVLKELNSQKLLVNTFRQYAKNDRAGDSYWENQAKEEENKLPLIEKKIEQEKQKLLKKGIDVADMERRTEQSQQASEAIQRKIDDLENFQRDLAARYRREAEAKSKEQGDVLSTYLDERREENNGGFYKIRPKEAASPIPSRGGDIMGGDVLYRINNTKDRIEALFNKAVSGDLKGKPISIGTLTKEGKDYLEKLSGITFKDRVDFVLNPSDLVHIYKRHFGSNEKDGRNIPLDIDDIRSIADIISHPDKVIFSIEEGAQERKMFSFIKEADRGSYNLLEIYSDRKGNLTAKSFYKSKEGVSQRAISLARTLHSTSETGGATLNTDANIPQLFENTPTTGENLFRIGETKRIGRQGKKITFTRANPTVTLNALKKRLENEGVEYKVHKARTGSGYISFEREGIYYDLRSANHTRAYTSYNASDDTGGVELSFTREDGRIDGIDIDLSENEMGVNEIYSLMDEAARFNANDTGMFAVTERLVYPEEINGYEHIAAALGKKADDLIREREMALRAEYARYKDTALQGYERPNLLPFKAGNGAVVEDESVRKVYFNGKPAFKRYATEALSEYFRERNKAMRDFEAAHAMSYDEWLASAHPEIRQEEDNMRDGRGAVTDDEVSMENDPMSKLAGKSIRTRKQRQAFAERERRRMAGAVREMAERLHLDNVEIVTDAGALTGRRARAKGFYSPRTGKITIVIPNHASEADAMQTLLHEAVAHYGLRQLFGEHFDTFLWNVYRNADRDVRERINALASEKGWDFPTATEEYLASLAENTDFENAQRSGWWEKIKRLFIDMLHKIGLDGFSGVTLSDNELRYILWRSYENLREPGAERSITGVAADVVKQAELKVGNYAEETTGGDMAAERKSAMTEKQRRIEKLRRSEPVVLKGDEIEPSEDLKQYKKNALEYGKKLRGEYTNKDTNETISLTAGNSRGGIREILQHDYKDVEHLQSIAAIPQIIENSIFIDELPNEDNKKYPGVKSFSYYVCGLKINGVDYTVKAVIANQSNGERYYDHKLTNIEKGELLSIVPTIQKAGIDSKTPYSSVKDKRLVSILQTDEEENEDELMYRGGGAEEDGQRKRGFMADMRLAWENLGRLMNPTKGNDLITEAARQAAAIKPDDAQRKKKLRRLNAAVNLAIASTKMHESYVDKAVSLRPLLAAVEGWTGRPLADEFNIYLHYDKYTSLHQAGVKEFYENEYADFMEAVSAVMETKGCKVEDVWNYMFLKHGLERNSVMAKRDADREFRKGETDKSPQELYEDNRKKEYSGVRAVLESMGMNTEGMTLQEVEKEAEKHVKDFEVGVTGNTIDNLWDKTRRATSFAIEREYRAGILSRQQRDDILNMYQYYIPLRGWADPKAEELFSYDSSLDSGYSVPEKQSKGRKSVADSPAAYIAAAAQTAIIRSVRNEMKKQIYYLAELTEGSGLMSVGNVWEVQDATGDWSIQTAQITDDMTAEQADAETARFEKEMGVLARQGKARLQGEDMEIAGGRKLSKEQLREHQVYVKINGRTKIVTVNTDNSVAKAINNSFSNIDNNRMMTGWMTFQRFMAGMMTQFNPEFIISNLLRDMTSAMTYGGPVNIGREVPAAVEDAVNYFIRKKKLTETDALFQEFIRGGGETGYVHLLELSKIDKDFRNEIRRLKGGAAYNILHKNLFAKHLDYVSRANEAVEVLTRYAAYRAARKEGKSISRAIDDAKNITANFNRKGSQTMVTGYGAPLAVLTALSPILPRMYAFFNAAIQGAYAFFRAAARNPLRVWPIVALSFAEGILQAFLGDGDDDEDKYQYINDYLKRSTISFVAGDKHSVSIPMAYELSAWHAIGHLLYETVNGDMDVPTFALESLSTICSSFTPVAFDGIQRYYEDNEYHYMLSPFLPTNLTPIGELLENRDWLGSPIARKNMWNASQPEYRRVYERTGQFYVEASKWLNYVSGGNDVEKGAVNINPAQVEHFIEGYFSGTGRFYSRTTGVLYDLLTEGELRNASEMPVISRFVKPLNFNSIVNKQRSRLYDDMHAGADKAEWLDSYMKGESGEDAMTVSKRIGELLQDAEYLKYKRAKKVLEATKELEVLHETAENAGDKDVAEKIEERIKRMYDDYEEYADQIDGKSD